MIALLIINSASSPASQVESPGLTVNGNPIVTARPVTRVGDEWFLPLLPIASAVGGELQISGTPPQLNARRSDGTTLSYDSRTGEVRSQSVLIGRVKNFQQVQIVGLNEDLLFPLGGVVALLGVEIYEDTGRNLLVVQTQPASRLRTRINGPFFNLGTVDYIYGMTTNGKDYGEYANMRGQILAGNIRTTENLIMSGLQGPAASRVIQGWVRADFSPGRAVVAGDQSTYSGVEAFTNAVRGVGVENRFRGFASDLYAGRAISTTFAAVGPVGIPKYDTKLAGFDLRRTSRSQEFVFAGNYFENPNRKGMALGTAYRIGSRIDQFRIQSSLGRFASSASPGLHPALGLTATNIFNLSKYVTVTGQVDRYDNHFRTVRDETRFTGQFNKSGSLVLRPAQWLNFNGSYSDRLFLQTGHRSRMYSYGADGLLIGARLLQWSAFRSVQNDDTSPAGRFNLEQFSISAPNIHNYSVYTSYSTIRMAGNLVRNVNLVVLNDRGRYGRFGFHDQVQPGTTKRLGIDWTLQSHRQDGFIRAAIDRVRNVNQQPSLAPSISMKVPLPAKQTVLLTFTREGRSTMLQLEFGGHVDRHREFAVDDRSGAVAVVRSRIRGRVYLDSDFNGEFNAKFDTPVPDISVWMDDDKVVRTDAQGMFRFDDVVTNAHKIRASLDGVPADLVFADLPERTTAVVPYNENIVNFRVVKAGRITGIVTYPDHPATDVRIIASGDRDTFSEANGGFLLSDLTPGTYELHLDAESIPEPYIAKPATVTVQVKPGQASENINFELVIPPRRVIEKSLPIQQGQ